MLYTGTCTQICEDAHAFDCLPLLVIKLMKLRMLCCLCQAEAEVEVLCSFVTHVQSSLLFSFDSFYVACGLLLIPYQITIH